MKGRVILQVDVTGTQKEIEELQEALQDVVADSGFDTVVVSYPMSSPTALGSPIDLEAPPGSKL